MDTKPLLIAYSGSLDAYSGVRKKSFLKFFLQWIWTYKHDTVDASTRSAYYLIKAVRILKDKYLVGPDRLKLEFWGNINPLNQKQAKDENVSEYFEFGGYLPKSDSLKKLNSADLLFLPLEKSNTKGFGTLFIPGKLYEYINSGKPVLALCEPSDCRTILERSGLGICVNPDDPEAIAEKLNSILTGIIRLDNIKADNEFISGFDFRLKTGELAKVFDSLIVK